jgi:hypothetical protein
MSAKKGRWTPIFLEWTRDWERIVEKRGQVGFVEKLGISRATRRQPAGETTPEG